jgi:hypothetical protein
METSGDKIMPNLCPRFSCQLCHYNTSKKSSYDNHLNSKKHKMVTDGSKTGQNYAVIMPNHLGETTLGLETFNCACGKQYLHRQGLWRHKKYCLSQEKNKFNGMDKDELIIMLLKQNAELIKGQQDLIKNQQEVSLEIVKNGTTNTNSHNTTTNSNNKAFNLNFFLNETCKNAMNITDFVESIKLQLSDFMNMGEVGFVENISNIITKNLNSLDETVRPIHCTDQKRETFYVKDDDKWEKEEDDRKKLKKMIKGIAYKNEKLIKKYKETYPDYNNSESKRSDQYSKIMIEAMDCKDESREKIIRNISKATTIVKA